MFQKFSYSLLGIVLFSQPCGSMNPAEDPESTEAHYQALRSINPFVKSRQSGDAKVYEQTFEKVIFDEKEKYLGPHFKDQPDGPVQLYESVELYAEGGGAGIFKAALKKDRPESGLKQGDIIAVRCRSVGTYFWWGSLNELMNLVRCSSLRQYTPYFPEFYGYFLSRHMPPCIINGNTYRSMASYPGEYVYRYEEMTFVDDTFDQFADQDGQRAPNSVLFETTLGEWASDFYLGITIGDRKSRNFGIKYVPYYRHYTLGERHYVFPPGPMPTRLDLDSFMTTQDYRFERIFISECLLETREAKGFTRNLENRGGDIFTLFEIYFSKYSLPVPKDSSVRYFTIPQKDIAKEQALPFRGQNF